jgi:predicted acylesterase/phospholipase RssA
MNDGPNPAEVRELPQVTSIDLALSGGGFRATLFHLGVIGFLRDRGLLRRVKIICSVSGGSILAAHLLMYWDEYVSGDDGAFENRVRHLVNSIRTRDVSGNVLKKSGDRILRLLPPDSELLVSEYRELLASDGCEITRWDDLDGKQGLPKLHILATHLNTGRAGAFSANGFRIPTVSAGQRHATEINAFAAFAGAQKIGHQEIARAVAASSAFPPAFSPIRLIPEDPTQVLTDGGVYDNSGVIYLKDLYVSEGLTKTKDRMVIVSDAGREFPTKLGRRYESFQALTMRVTDTQRDRIADADSNAAKAFFDSCGIPNLRLSIHEVVKHFPEWHSNHSVKVQELLGMIRTELDTFSEEEVFVLYRHGYLVTQNAFAEFCHETPGAQFMRTGVPWTPVDPAKSPGAVDQKDPGGIAKADLREIEKDDLERRLEESHINQKPAMLLAIVPRWILVWLLRSPPFWLCVFACVCLCVGYYSDVWKWPTFNPPVVAIGALEITSIEPYDSEGWAARTPTLTPVLTSPESKFVYTMTTSPIGSLTSGRPHAAAVAHLQPAGLLSSAEVYLFLEQQASTSDVKRVVLEEVAPRKLKVPAGVASDRLRGVIVSRTEIKMLQATVRQELAIELEAP